MHRLAAALALTAVVVAGAFIWRHENNRDEKLARACEDAARLRSLRLIDQAQGVLAVVRRADDEWQCEEVNATGLRRLQRERAQAFELARSQRRAARVARRTVGEPVRRRWASEALRAYMAGLAIDPVSPGARSGLRSALRARRGRGAHAARLHCRRAVRLLVLRLIREARAEYVRAVAAGGERSCEQVGSTLRAERRTVYGHLREAESRERAGEVDRARSSYAAALALDPGVHEALDGLSTTQPTIPAPIDWLKVAGDAPPVGAAIAFAALVLVPIALVFWYLFGVRPLGLFGRLRPIGWVYGKLPWFKWLNRERLFASWTSTPEYIQQQAWEVARGELKVPAPLAAGYAAPMLASSSSPTEYAPSSVGPGGPEADLLRAMPLFDRLLAFGRLLRRLGGIRRYSVSIEPVAGDGFRIGHVVPIGASPVNPQLAVDVEPEYRDDPEALGVVLASGIRQQRGPA